MSSASQEIFADDFEKKHEEEKKQTGTHPQEKPPELDTEFPPIPNIGDPDDDKPPKPNANGKGSKKRGIIGAIVIGLIIAGVVFGFEQYFGEDLTKNMNPIELGKSIDQPKEKEQEKPKPAGQPEGSGGTKDVSSASDKVELEKTNEPIGYYMIKSNDNWYGDYVDFRKIPNKIEKSGDMKVSFRCYTDDFAGTSTYFATFRNQIADKLKVDVYIRDKLVQTKETVTNKAIIVEGSCLQ